MLPGLLCLRVASQCPHIIPVTLTVTFTIGIILLFVSIVINIAAFVQKLAAVINSFVLHLNVLSALNDFEKTADDASEESAIFPELDSMETGFLIFLSLTAS